MKKLKIVYQTELRKNATCFTGMHRQCHLPLNKPQWQLVSLVLHNFSRNAKRARVD